MTVSEKQVADYLKELQLWWQYESPVFLKDEKERPRVWTPGCCWIKLYSKPKSNIASQASYRYGEALVNGRARFLDKTSPQPLLSREFECRPD
jgi:hypothetical protein